MNEKKYLDSDTAYDEGALSDWYISSVDDSDPIWTDAHIYELVNDFYVIPKDTPVVDVAPVVHGHWIYGEDESGQDGYSCSECDFFVPWYYKYYEQGLHFIKDYHLCPQCGAKMDESEDSGND